MEGCGYCPAQTGIMSQAQTITVAHSPGASTVQSLSQHGDGWSTAESKNKTANSWLLSLVTPVCAFGQSQQVRNPPENQKRKEPCTVNISVSAGRQSTPGGFTDNTASNRAEEPFSEITSCSFCLGWQPADSPSSTAHGCPSLTYFDSVLARLQHSVPALALGCGFFCTFAVSLGREKKHSVQDKLILFRNHLAHFPHYMKDYACCPGSMALARGWAGIGRR